MDEATKVSIEALKRIREQEAEKNPRHRKLKREKVERGEGAALLEDVLKFLSRFIAYPSDHALIAHVLWIAHTHLMTAWESTPRLAFLSPEPASGKTRSMEVTELLVPMAVAAVNVTPAYLFRKVGGEDGPPTILFDEIDTVFGPKAKEHEEIRALLNSGHRRGAVAGRCLVRGKIVETEEISSYAAVALAGLGWLPDTILSRSIIIRMRRRAPDETIEAFRRRVHAPQGEALCRRLAGWAATILDEATEARPDMPAGVEDRNADMWEPLFAVADLAGGDWLRRARAAAVALVQLAHEVEPSLNIRLLADVRTVFGDEQQLATKKILVELCLIEDAPWNDLKGKPITHNQLARRLKEYGVKPKTLRLNDGHFAKGYARADLHEVWRRYLPPSPDKAVTAVTSVTEPISCGLHVTPVPGRGSNVTPPEANRVTPVTAPSTACDGLANQRNAHEIPVVTPVTPVTALSDNGDDPGDIPVFLRRSPGKSTPTGPSEKNWLEWLEGAAMSAAEVIKVARDAGIELAIDGDDLVLEGPAPPPATLLDLLSRHKAQVVAILAATAHDNKLLARTPISESVTDSAEGEPGDQEPCAARRGRVQEKNGVFLHFCVECGRSGPFGYGVRLRAGQLGRWYCRGHRPQRREP